MYYSAGKRRMNIFHTRLRLGSSTLNAHLHPMGLHPSSSCGCGHQVESTQHFLLHCPQFANPRDKLCIGIRDIVAPGTNPNLLPHLDESKYTNILLFGSIDTSDEDNVEIFNVVQTFIDETTRFN